MDYEPIIDSKRKSDIISAGHPTGMPGWCAFWDAYHYFQSRNGIAFEPSQLHNYVRCANLYDQVVAQYYDIPIGSWPKSGFRTLLFGHASNILIQLFLR